MVYISDVCSTKNKNGQKYGFGGEFCFFGHFFELMPEAFPFFCCLKPVFWVFLAWRRPFFDFFPWTKCRRHEWGEKRSKRGLLKAKKPQKRAEGNRKTEMLKAEVHKNAQKNMTNPQNHIYVHFYFLSNKRQRLIFF